MRFFRNSGGQANTPPGAHTLDRGGSAVRETPVVIRCEFFEDGKRISEIWEGSFRLYLTREFAFVNEKPYHDRDEWPLISGGQLCIQR